MPKKKSIKKKKKKVLNSKLERLSKKYEERYRKMIAFKVRHDRTFTRLEKFRAELQEIEIRIKDIARESSEMGRTINLVDAEGICVKVTGPKARVTYDPTLARKWWPPDVLNKVLTIDTSKVTEEYKKDHIDEKILKKAELPPEPLTPRVTIDVKQID